MSKIGYKNLDVLVCMFEKAWHHNLIYIVCDLCARYSKITVTSAYRSGDSKCHGTIPLRAIDIRSTHYDNPREIVEYLNSHYKYDPKRKDVYSVAKMHDTGKGMHIHIQVHDNTTIIKGTTI